MSRGGKRPNSGRRRGSANRINAQAREKAMSGGISPLDYLLSVMRNRREPKRMRMDAAKAALPFVHARLAVTESVAGTGLGFIGHQAEHRSAMEIIEERIRRLAEARQREQSDSDQITRIERVIIRSPNKDAAPAGTETRGY